MRTGDRPADHKPPPDDPPVPPVGKLLPRLSSAGGSPGLSLSLTVTPGLRHTARPRPPHTLTSFLLVTVLLVVFIFALSLPPADPTSPFSFPFEEMSLEKEMIGGFSPRKLQR